PQMAAIWTPETRFRIWFEIEAHAADAMAELGMIPKAAAKKIWAKGKAAQFDIDRIEEIERETKHDVVAFLTHLAEIVGPDARFVHQGMTSSDVLDTCLNVQLMRAADVLIADVDRVLAALKRRAFEYKIAPAVEAHVAKAMGLEVEPISTQVIPRDRHAMYFATLGVIASSMERLATEIRHMQRTEVLEAEEFFAEGQKGSSAMPHKRNPVL